MKKGRPSKFSKSLADKICGLIADGKTLREIGSLENMPVTSTICKWINENKTFSEQYARSKERMCEIMVEEIIEIADNGTNDYMTIKKGNLKYNVEDKEVTNRSRLRVDTRKWLLSKLLPKKYGDTVKIASDADNPLRVLTEIAVKRI